MHACAQVQVADIGLMGGPAKFEGKATEGVRIFLGGTIGENPVLASEFEKGIACEESVLLPKLRDILMERFGATPKAGVLQAA
jgi:ferredoxin-nitrite reductase